MSASPIATATAVFIGANTHTGVSDFCPERTEIAFGAGTTIALWRPLTAAASGVQRTLKHHSGEVLNVKYCHGGKYLISTSADQSVKVWKRDSEQGAYQLHQSLDEEHGASVNCLSISSTGDDQQEEEKANSTAKQTKVVATSSADGNIVLWVTDSHTGSLQKVHSFEVGNSAKSSTSFYPLSLHLTKVGADKFVLFVGGTKPSLFVYSFAIKKAENGAHGVSGFAKCAVLPGHENWIKALAVKRTGENEYLVASGSLDRYIRLWKLNTNIDDTKDESSDQLKLLLLSNKKYKFTIGEEEEEGRPAYRCSINFEALILGHDDWISCLNWSPDNDKLQLMSTSADTSIMVWEPDMVSGVWVTTTRLGELSIKGASTATGASGGFWSSLWFQHEQKQYILTHGRTGSWRVWSADFTHHASSPVVEWKQELGITGPFKDVTDVTWSKNQDYLLSTSLDQTTRLFAPWKFESDGITRPQQHQTWREFARPQIHGYDMVCVSSLSNSRFVSGGDEKVMRSFDEPKSIFKLLNRFSGIQSLVDENAMPQAASLPTLGLSNKAETDTQPAETEQGSNEDDDDANEERNISYEVLAELQQPPLEDHLQRHTLWPELEKLYGHGYELTTLDSSHDSRWIVSCCKSNNARHAVLRVFDSDKWLEVKPALQFHELTVTRVRFSKDDRYIFSVSRDRKIGLWERKTGDVESNTAPYELKFSNNKAHTRIIWDGDWAPLDVGYMFVSGSRDKSIKIWSVTESGFEVLLQVKFSEPVTAVSVLGKTIVSDAGKSILVAVGLESGGLAMYLYNVDTKEGKLVEKLGGDITPNGRNNRLAFKEPASGDEKYVLAVGSADHSVRLYSLDAKRIL